MITLSLDIGGTRMKLALLEDGKILLERMVEAYRDDKYQKNLDTAEREGKAMMAELGIARIDGLGIAFPGLVNPRDKVVVSANGKFVDAVGTTSSPGWRARSPAPLSWTTTQTPRSWARPPTAARRTRATS